MVERSRVAQVQNAVLDAHLTLSSNIKRSRTETDRKTKQTHATSTEKTFSRRDSCLVSLRPAARLARHNVFALLSTKHKPPRSGQGAFEQGRAKQLSAARFSLHAHMHGELQSSTASTGTQLRRFLVRDWTLRHTARSVVKQTTKFNATQVCYVLVELHTCQQQRSSLQPRAHVARHQTGL